MSDPELTAERRLVSVVVPVFYNEESLPGLFAGLDKAASELTPLSVDLEIVLVDDGSSDGSFELMRGYFLSRDRVQAIRLSRNFGGVNAIKAGLQHATGEAAIVMAADLQDPPAQIPLMVREWLGGSRFVICERASRSRDDGLVVRFTSTVYHRLVRALIVRNYPLGGFDMLLVDSVMLPYLQDGSKSMYPQILAFWLGFEPTVLVYDRPSRPFGRSRWSTKKRFGAFANIFFGYSVVPIQVATAIGAMVAAVSITYAMVVLVSTLTSGATAPGFSALAVLVAFLSGLILLTLGMLGQYIWRIYDQLSGRPDAVVDIALVKGEDE
jgi:dolichol-phosphate mannosyltransferase